MLLRLDDAKIPGLYSIDGYIDVSQMADDEVVRDILNRLNMLDHNAIEKELPADAGLLVPEAKLATNAEISWDGIEVQGTYYAWAGPLLAMEDKAAIPYSPQLITALQGRDIPVSFGNPELLSDHLGRGRSQVFVTDKKNWRRPVTRGRQFLLVKAPGDTVN